MWGKNAEVAERYIRKGTQIYLEGRLRTRAWEDRNQVKRFTTEIYVDTFELLARPANAVSPQQPAAQPQQPKPANQNGGNAPF